jgi:hypothetical protein
VAATWAARRRWGRCEVAASQDACKLAAGVGDLFGHMSRNTAPGLCLLSRKTGPHFWTSGPGHVTAVGHALRSRPCGTCPLGVQVLPASGSCISSSQHAAASAACGKQLRPLAALACLQACVRASACTAARRVAAPRAGVAGSFRRRDLDVPHGHPPVVTAGQLCGAPQCQHS